MIDGESKGNRFGKSVDAAATVPDDRLRVDEENFCRLLAQGNTASRAAGNSSYGVMPLL